MRQQFLSALFAVAALAAPVEEATPAKQGFQVQQVYAGKVLKNGPLQVQKAYEKYGKVPPTNVVKAAAARAAVQSGKVTATPDTYDSSYLCNVNVGGYTLPLDFDTGSSDLWVFSNLQPSTQRSGHPYYTVTSSKKLAGETWQISYGDGSGAKGVVYADTVVIGGVTATSQAVEAATSVSSTFASGDNSGLVGLAFDNINTCYPNVCKTFMDNIASSLPSKLFTSYLKHNKAGSYTFGYIDSTQYTGSITYVAVNKANGFWEFTGTGYSVGSATYSLSLDSIADTGTTLVYMPDAVCSKYYASVSGAQNSASAGGWIFPCSSSLPNLSFTIGGTSHTIPGSFMNYAPVSSTQCYGGLQSSNGIGFNILGDIFLKSQLAVFDYGNTRIGFAQSAN